MRLKNKVALITGAAMGLKERKMGIGGATAWLFAKEGARVMLSDYNQDLGKETTSQIPFIFVRLVKYVDSLVVKGKT